MAEKGDLTVGQAARVLGLSPSTIVNQIHRGVLPAHKRNGSRAWYIWAADVRAYKRARLGKPGRKSKEK